MSARRIGLTEHAILRYVERVKPALDFKQARGELTRLIAAAAEPVPAEQAPEWAWPIIEGQCVLELCDGIVAILEPDLERPGRLACLTVVTRAGLTAGARAHRNRKAQARRSARRGRAKGKGPRDESREPLRRRSSEGDEHIDRA